MPADGLDEAAAAIGRGELVVYPTETVYGLGADALNSDAIERVFEAKRRARKKPLSMAVPDVDSALEHAHVTDREERFMRAFLPGPVTVVVERGAAVPDVLTAGSDRVGIRIPDHDLARSLLERTPPITSTSANVSGNPSARRAADVDPAIREAAAVVLDGGETQGTESTVVDLSADEILREGAMADEIESWLAR